MSHVIQRESRETAEPITAATFCSLRGGGRASVAQPFPPVAARPQIRAHRRAFVNNSRRIAIPLNQRFAAAWEPSARSITPIILSAIKQCNRRVVLPRTISSGGDVLLPTLAPRTSLCSLRIATDQPKIHYLFAGTQSTLSGAADLDTKTGAAIHVRPAPREFP